VVRAGWDSRSECRRRRGRSCEGKGEIVGDPVFWRKTNILGDGGERPRATIICLVEPKLWDDSVASIVRGTALAAHLVVLDSFKYCADMSTRLSAYGEEGLSEWKSENSLVLSSQRLRSQIAGNRHLATPGGKFRTAGSGFL